VVSAVDVHNHYLPFPMPDIDLRYFARKPDASVASISAYQSISTDFHNLFCQMVARKRNLKPTRIHLAHPTISKEDYRSYIKDNVIAPPPLVEHMLFRVATCDHCVDGEDVSLFD